ncbi:ATP-binding protein [Aquimonas voraii]|uniref:histidine kinase n=1 Tax=Aquimonas voraii TaxID=265719 RepID=A0A1G6XPH8_9GAMM|nr:ATP-binding protein [Aquimonas voraii]SDD80119.1 two-component system, OmpR family, sensor histidine kinase RstB [Aquimonas voraii]
MRILDSTPPPTQQHAVSSLFVRLYVGLILAMLLIAGGVVATLSLLEAQRAARYREAVLSAPMQLMAEGVARHAGEERQRWIDIAARLLTSELRVETTPQPPSELVVERMGEQQHRARLALPGSDNEQLVLLFQNWTEQQWRATTFLLLNELGRLPAGEQREALQRIADRLPYPLRHLGLDEVDLDPRQRERIAAGEVVMQIEWRDGGRPSTRFFAPYGERGDVLAVGPVPSLGPLPASTVLMLIVAAALAFSGVAVWAIRTLERRLQHIDRALARFGASDFELGELGPASPDAIGRLAQTTHRMAGRIRSLLRSQQELVQGISHDLRTPVARVRLRLELLQADASQQERIAGIRRDLDELESLIDAAITYSRLDEGGIVLASQPIDVAQELRAVVQDQRVLARDIELSTDLQVPARPLAADRALLRRAVQNLLGNALRHARSRVEVELREAVSGIRIAIEDDGPGVPESQRERIFEPFSRLDESRSKASGGYGLGLAIVRRIAERHGGRIACGAARLGGARFELELPWGIASAHSPAHP